MPSASPVTIAAQAGAATSATSSLRGAGYRSLRVKLAALAAVATAGSWIVVAAVALGATPGTVVAIAVALTAANGLLGAALYWGAGLRLRHIVATLREAAGRGSDFAQLAAAEGRDEVGELAQHYNAAVARMQAVIHDVRTRSMRVAYESALVAGRTKDAAAPARAQDERAAEIFGASEQATSAVAAL